MRVGVRSAFASFSIVGVLLVATLGSSAPRVASAGLRSSLPFTEQEAARGIVSPGGKRGDVTRDGVISAFDALATLSHVVGRALPESFTMVPNGDVNCDAQVRHRERAVVLGSYSLGS